MKSPSDLFESAVQADAAEWIQFPERIDAETGYRFLARPVRYTHWAAEFLDPDTDEPCGTITVFSCERMRRSRRYQP